MPRHPQSRPPTLRAAVVAAKPKVKRHPLHLRIRSRPGVVIVIPRDDVLHCPEVAVEAIVHLCERFDGVSADSCSNGASCADAHVTLDRAVEHVFHERSSSWVTTDDVPYPRFAAGVLLPVAAPNTSNELELLNPQLILQTRAVEAERRPLSRCAHFERKGFCTLGAACEFVHVLAAVSVAPILCGGDRAGPDVYEPLPTFTSSDVEAEGSDEHDRSTAIPSLGTSRSNFNASSSSRRHYRHDPYRANPKSPLVSPLTRVPIGLQTRRPSSDEAEAPLHGANNTFSSSDSRTSLPRRRFNPYSLVSPVVWL